MSSPVHIVVHNRSAALKSQSPIDSSPVIYLHHGYESVAGYIAELHKLMEDERGRVGYSAARLIGIAHKDIGGSLSLGVYNAPYDFFYRRDYLDYLKSYADGSSWVLYDCQSGAIETVNCDTAWHHL